MAGERAGAARANRLWIFFFETQPQRSNSLVVCQQTAVVAESSKTMPIKVGWWLLATTLLPSAGCSRSLYLNAIHWLLRIEPPSSTITFTLEKMALETHVYLTVLTCRVSSVQSAYRDTGAYSTCISKKRGNEKKKKEERRSRPKKKKDTHTHYCHHYCLPLPPPLLHCLLAACKRHVHTRLHSPW